jgi:hypothetical protein
MTGTALPEHPEARGEALISSAVHDILCEQFKDELAFGTRVYPSGNDAAAYAGAKAHTFLLLKNAIANDRATYLNFLMMHAYEIAAETDPERLRRMLVSLGGTVVQYIEALDSDVTAVMGK